MKKILFKVASLTLGSLILCSSVYAKDIATTATSSTARTLSDTDYKIVMYSLPNCWACKESKEIFDKAGLKYETISVGGNDELRKKLADENAGWNWFPMIFINGTFFGTIYQLKDLYATGALDKLVHKS